MGKLYAIIGASGSGKSTIGQYVFGKEKELVSTTTRTMRPNEVNGKHYHFVNKEEFMLKASLSKFAETDYYDGEYYGLTHDEIWKKTHSGDAFVVITYAGYLQIKELHENTIAVFIDASKEHVEAMLKGRNDTKIKERLALYDREIENRKDCDYVIRNEFGRMDSAVFQLLCLVRDDMETFHKLSGVSTIVDEVEIDG